MKTSVLPENFTRCMSAEDRKKFGKGAMTCEDALKKQEARSEKELQEWVANLLRLKGIEAIRSRMDRNTSNNVGCPDFLFSINVNRTDGAFVLTLPYSCAWEVKLPGKKLSEEQIKMHQRMTTPPNAWRWSMITCLDDAIRELREMGIE